MSDSLHTVQRYDCVYFILSVCFKNQFYRKISFLSLAIYTLLCVKFELKIVYVGKELHVDIDQPYDGI